MLKNTIRAMSFLENILESNCSLKIYHDAQKKLILKSFSTTFRFLEKADIESKSKASSIISSILPPSKDKSADIPFNEQSSHEDIDRDAEKQKQASWRTMKFTFLAFGVSISCLGLYVIYELGKAPVDEEGKPSLDEFSELPLLKQFLNRIRKEMEYYKKMIREPSRDKLLPDPLVQPFVQPKYTLVLELTDVLVHPDWTYQTGWRFKKRPGLDHFLESIHGIFEVVVYTAEQGITVFPLIEALDPNNIISYKLVRDATHFVDGHHVKNLDKLNRDLEKVIVIDWNRESVKFHPDSIFQLSRWKGNDDDTTLIDLASFLRTIAESEIEDVREVLKYYTQFDDPLATFRIKQKELMEQQEADRQRAIKDLRDMSIVKRWAPGLTKYPKL